MAGVLPAIITRATAFLARPGLLASIRNVLLTFLSVEAVETVMETIGASIAGVDEKQFKKGGRGVMMIDAQTGLLLGRTSRTAAIAHLRARRRPRVTRRTVILGDGGRRDIDQSGRVTVVR